MIVFSHNPQDRTVFWPGTGDGFGPFAGMEVSYRVSGEKSRLSKCLARLIANDEILMTLPNQAPSQWNLIKVRGVEGKPMIEPSYVIG